MKALVTGDAGFVGRHMRAALKDRGWLTYGMDIRRNKSEDARYAFAGSLNTRVDLLVHCAATVGGRETIEGEPLTVARNLTLDTEMFSWAVRTGIPRVVYFSSSAAYPIYLQERSFSRKRLLRESDIDLTRISNPDATYGWAKLTGEYLAQFAQKAGVRVHVFRPFSGYAEDQSPDYPFGAYRARALAHEWPFTVWGGSQKRDFIHIDDIVNGVFAAIDADYPDPLNLCTGRGVDFYTLANMFAPGVPVRCILDKPTGVFNRVGDPTNLLTVYEPRVSLELGIARALEG